MDVILLSVQWCAAERLNERYLDTMLEECAEFGDSSSMMVFAADKPDRAGGLFEIGGIRNLTVFRGRPQHCGHLAR